MMRDDYADPGDYLDYTNHDADELRAERDQLRRERRADDREERDNGSRPHEERRAEREAEMDDEKDAA